MGIFSTGSSKIADKFNTLDNSLADILKNTIPSKDNRFTDRIKQDILKQVEDHKEAVSLVKSRKKKTASDELADIGNNVIDALKPNKGVVKIVSSAATALVSAPFKMLKFSFSKKNLTVSEIETDIDNLKKLRTYYENVLKYGKSISDANIINTSIVMMRNIDNSMITSNAKLDDIKLSSTTNLLEKKYGTVSKNPAIRTMKSTFGGGKGGLIAAGVIMTAAIGTKISRQPIDEDAVKAETETSLEPKYGDDDWQSTPDSEKKDENLNVDNFVIFSNTEAKNGWNKLKGALSSAFLKFSKDYLSVTGSKVIVTSTYRSPEKQKQLYDAYYANPEKARENGILYAPGAYSAETSKSGKVSAHLTGDAIDVSTKSLGFYNFDGLLKIHGLIRPIKDDIVHITLASTPSSIDDVKREKDQKKSKELSAYSGDEYYRKINKSLRLGNVDGSSIKSKQEMTSEEYRQEIAPKVEEQDYFKKSGNLKIRSEDSMKYGNMTDEEFNKELERSSKQYKKQYEKVPSPREQKIDINVPEEVKIDQTKDISRDNSDSLISPNINMSVNQGNQAGNAAPDDSIKIFDYKNTEVRKLHI